ncbi:MAG TPA: CPBP family glutamic-type intramembrane protease [Candidatus Saccharimonadales bacterium]|nr:CPBP family glutamic-type intramembrane protease [Candidatus Saccharimonadales bacterium]
MFTGFWFDFTILLLAALVGSIAIIPYSMRLLKASPKGKKLKLPLWMISLLSILQNAVLFAIAISVGLILSHQMGHGAPLIDALRKEEGWTQAATSALLIGFVLGALGGSFLLIADLFFVPYFPKKLLDTALQTTFWENMTASLYGGINEEIFMRLCGLSLVVWLLSKIWHSPIEVFWTANIVIAILFAIGHLPTLKTTIGEISRIMLFRSLLLNIPIGLICGWLFWNNGIEAAIVAHYSADIVYHVIGTFILRKKVKQT